MNTRNERKKRIFEIIQIGNRSDLASRAFDYFIAAVILANIVVLFMETFDQLTPWNPYLYGVEVLTMLIFCVEYGLRIWTADYLYPKETRGKAIFHFIRSYDGVVELLTILPFFMLEGLVAFRMLRVVRIFHLFRINAAYDSFNVITSVIKEKLNQIMSSIFIILVLILASSLSIYAIEHPIQPDVYQNAFSGIWWSMSTIFTIGYGDIYPVTLAGRLLTVVITFLGVGAVAIPTGIISAGFVEQYTTMKHSGAVDISPDVCAAKPQAVLTVKPGSIYADRQVGILEDELDMDILVIIRGGDALLQSEETMVRQGDVLVYTKN